jgi:5,10-methylenetetrahydromethanopterin reductase
MPTMLQIWRGPTNVTTADIAPMVEAEGWDGQLFMDSQSLAADPYVRMGAWASVTRRLQLSPGVTNPVTRHPAVTAASIASLQAISGGRASLGIGRGDSALAYLGRAPMKLAAFERTLRNLQSLLSGARVSFDSYGPGEDSPSLDSLSLGDRPKTYGLQWLPEGLPKTPLDVAATGPKVIEMAAVIAEKVTFSVGAIPERIRWAVDTARAARLRAGLPADGVSFGAQIICICHPDRALARQAASGVATSLARFQVIQRHEAAGPTTEMDRRNFDVIRKTYNMNKHTAAGEKLVGNSIDPEFLDRFAILGPPDYCIERLRELIACGLNRLVIVGPGRYPGEPGGGSGLFSTDVMPSLRSALESR